MALNNVLIFDLINYRGYNIVSYIYDFKTLSSSILEICAPSDKIVHVDKIAGFVTLGANVCHHSSSPKICRRCFSLNFPSADDVL